MLFTVIYAVTAACRWIYCQYWDMSFTRLIHSYLPHTSVTLRRCVKSASGSLPSSSLNQHNSLVLVSNNVFEMSAIEPQVAVCLAEWTRRSQFERQSVSILMKLVRSTDVTILNCKQVNTLCRVLAVKRGEPDSILVQCSPSELVSLVQCYMSGVNLMTDNSYLVDSLTTVRVTDTVDESARDSVGTTKLEHLEHSRREPPASSLMYRYEVPDYTVNDDESRKVPTVSPTEVGSSISPLRKANLRRKPPNIVIYCGKKDSTRLYETVKSVICLCINTSCYTVYHLKHDHVTTTPWNENALLLIIASDKAYDGVDQRFLDYFLHGGTLVSFGSMFDSLIVRRKDRKCDVKGVGVLRLRYNSIENEHFAAICTRYCYDVTETVLPSVKVSSIATDRDSGEDVIVEAVMKEGSGVAILSQVNLEKDPVEMAISNEVFMMLKRSNNLRFEALASLFKRIGVDCSKSELPSLTAIRLLTKSEATKSSFLRSIMPRLQESCLISRELTLQFVAGEQSNSLPITAANVPVFTNSLDSVAFNAATYFQHHSANVLGNTILYADVITTTMKLFDGLMFSCPEGVGLVAVARQQVAGQGRGGNAWLSPTGCAMFSLHVRVPLLSTLGQRSTYIQHLMALAVVMAVRQKDGCQSLDLRIKWPNDIYFGHDVKLGGVIVKSTIMDNIIHANIGCGVNITNKDPTMCINDLLSRVDVSPKPDCFTVEEFIARAVTSLEQLITEFQTFGLEAFLNQYYKYWLHSDANVRLGSDNGKEATVVGLDDYGFLLVRLHQDGSTVSVQPDGNSYDIMKNLILPKIN